MEMGGGGGGGGMGERSGRKSKRMGRGRTGLHCSITGGGSHYSYKPQERDNYLVAHFLQGQTRW